MSEEREDKADSLYDQVVADERLTPKQKAWLIAFFGEGPTQWNVTASCRAANCSQMSCWNWRNREGQYPVFKEYYELFYDTIASSAELGMIHQIEAGNWSAIQFALSKLNKRYRDKIDITSGEQPISSITVVPILPKDQKDGEGETPGGETAA